MLNRIVSTSPGRGVWRQLHHQGLVSAITHAPDKALVFQRLLGVAEAVQARELNDPVLSEALAILMGGGLEGAQVGMRRVRQLMGDYVRQYLRYAQQLGISRENTLPGGLARFL